MEILIFENKEWDEIPIQDRPDHNDPDCLIICKQTYPDGGISRGDFPFEVLIKKHSQRVEYVALFSYLSYAKVFAENYFTL